MFNITGPLTIDQATILVVRLLGLHGDIRAIEFWAERTEGRSPQVIDIQEPAGPLFVVMPPSQKAIEPPQTPPQPPQDIKPNEDNKNQ